MKRASLIATALTALCLALPAQAEEPKVYRDAEQAFLERTSLAAADEKCKYFTDLERSALIAGQLQARGVLLRAGFTIDDIDKAAQEVQLYANRQPCGSEDFMKARSHLKSAFQAFIGTMVMDYPGEEKIWNASRSRWDTWRLVQNGSSDAFPFQFGLLAPMLKDPNDFPAAFARPLDAPLQTEPFTLSLDIKLPETMSAPSLARILLRDEAKAPEPWLGSIFKKVHAPPPRALTKAYWSSGREEITDEESGVTTLRFTFSPETTAAIEKLDPRERFEIAITPNARSASAETIYLEVEVGDFAAGHAFTKLPPL